MIQLRPYQQSAINKCKESFLNGNRKILLSIGTGGGKSIVCRKLFEMALQKNKDAKLLYIVHRNILINQMKQTLSGLNVRISTLQAIGREPTDVYDIVLSDETHFGHGSKLMNNINYKFFIGVTATPISSDGYPLDGYDEIIDVAQLKDLIDMGFMPKLKVLSGSNVDTTKLKKTGADFNIKQSFHLMNKSKIMSDIVGAYEKYAKGLKTILYCVNIKHSENVAKAFTDKGYECGVIHSKSKDKDLDKFKNGEINIIANCDVLTTGLDLPDVYCLILASPTKSYIKSTQIYGRIRLNPKDKDKVGLIIDCANVIGNTQHPMQKIDLNREKPKRDKNIPQHCNKDMAKIESKIIPIDKYEYCIYTKWKCDCGEIKEVQEIKLINPKACESCGKEIGQETEKETYIDNSKKLQFGYLCPHCGSKIPLREIEYSSDELKEIAYQGSTWEDVRTLLKIEAKASGYHYRWVDRAIDTLKNKGKCADEVISYIKHIKEQNNKIGRICFL
jgi:superfamily II DNA or RNA helicase